MVDRRLGRLKRSFLDDRRVERTPPRVLAVRDQSVADPQGAPMSFPDSKNRSRRSDRKHRRNISQENSGQTYKSPANEMSRGLRELRGWARVTRIAGPHEDVARPSA